MKVSFLNTWKRLFLHRLVSVLILIFAFGFFNPVFSVSEEEEERLLEKALVESAITPGQKQAIANYLKATAIAKRARASELRELAKLSRGEKFLQARVRKEKLFKMADSLDRQADRHEITLKDFQIESR
ncbi:hypothetical protein MAL08_03965 [Leptospira noguchii]|uniref:Uncharacterized protein n=2 Tax=Leptospira noguchii TaxID=28182 RepID=M6UVC7_9LEPT|nr:hypothetical protein [Leptospira noguchii]EMO27290.1 hypothetical protein LEP1GSC170_2105 [Leptospira interrogans serovar Bataviae str. HAI135]EMI70067.1 hypothetical protein LEP1GSC072_3922 [Leptospira noguchii str. Bonito]EMO41253.1 hypothetical protein LEP1GSC186_3071 [Leptospira noguchii serovar Autumnalis str. ZUN142]UOG31171.1 hypothetical protein MAL06_03710 [Leptospira noguchii]UOG34800.1 hypothetical protein MAL02_03365 [Leptospira noguchii]